MSKSCNCNLKISKTIISYNRGLYGIEYGVGTQNMEHKIQYVTSDHQDIMLPGTSFCPHNLPDNYNPVEYFSVIFKC